MQASPSRTESGRRIASRATMPTMNPAMSYAPGCVHARHLRRLAAEQRAAVRGARVGHRADDAREHRGIDPRGREVVEEEERLRAHRKRVVHAVVDEVGADDLVPVEKARDLQLRADAVGRRDQHAVRAG